MTELPERCESRKSMTSILSIDALKDFCLRLAACFFALTTPFFFLSAYRGHPASVSALVYSTIYFALAALAFSFFLGHKKGLRRTLLFSFIVCFSLNLQAKWFAGITAAVGSVAITAACWALREHLAVILATLFGAMFVSSLLIGSAEPYREHSLIIREDARPAVPADGILVHLILDEFAGPEGLPVDIPGGKELRIDLENFLLRNGMKVYPDAMSEYSSTKVSISGILNFEASPSPEKNYHGKSSYVLSNNQYFENLFRRGYAINVYQSTYLDYCTESPVPLAACYTYRYDGTDWLGDADLGSHDKLSVLLGIFLNHPGAMESMWKAYEWLRSTSAALGVHLPELMTWDGRVSPMASMSALSFLRANLAEAKLGSAHFAHLMLPHSPYGYDSTCTLRSKPLRWRNHHPLMKTANTSLQREMSYRQYFEQVRCAMHKLEALFDDLEKSGRWDRTEIIIHGDHGSRIFGTVPRARNREHLTPADLDDAFRTLFAFKSRDGQARVIRGTRPVSRLLKEISDAEATAGMPDHPSIYLEAGNDRPWLKLDWPHSPREKL